MTKFCQLSEPVMGSSRQLTPSHRISVSANQKFGMAWPDHGERQREAVDEAVGSHRRQHAQRNGEQERKERWPQAPRIMVTGSRAKMTSATGWRSV